MEMIVNFAGEFVLVLTEMAPWLLLGFAVAGLLHVLLPERFVVKHLSSKGFGSIVKASVLGVPLPLCSCGVIPVSASLRARGASPGATSSFLISTPQTGVDSVLVTYSLMGPVFALFRLGAAFVSGLLGGVLVGRYTDGGAGQAETPERHEADEKLPAWRRALRHGFVTLPGDLANSLIVGLLIAAAITVLIPPGLIGQIPGGRPVTMLAMLLLGLPIYVCATASVPIAAALVVAQGVSPGAALVFLMTGPATNTATIFTIRKMMGTRGVAFYLLAVMLTALASGVVLDVMVDRLDITPDIAMAHEMSGISLVGGLSAVVLAGLLGRPLLWSRLKRLRGAKADPARRVDLAVTGMTCSNCAERVRESLQADPAVTSASVDLKQASASAVLKDASCCEGACPTDAGEEDVPARLLETIRGAGYGAELLDTGRRVPAGYT